MRAKPPSKPSDPPEKGSSALRALIRSAQGAFSRPLTIERSQGKLRVALPEQAAATKDKRAQAADATAPASQVALMRADLKSHLDRREGTRAALPHLSTVEYELGKRGMRVFDQLPLPVLRRAAGQLNGLAQAPLLEGFVLLQARLDLAIVDREERAQADASKHKQLAPSSFLVDDKLQVSEASMSDFLRAAGDPAASFDTQPG